MGTHTCLPVGLWGHACPRALGEVVIEDLLRNCAAVLALMEPMKLKGASHGDMKLLSMAQRPWLQKLQGHHLSWFWRWGCSGAVGRWEWKWWTWGWGHSGCCWLRKWEWKRACHVRGLAGFGGRLRTDCTPICSRPGLQGLGYQPRRALGAYLLVLGLAAVLMLASSSIAPLWFCDWGHP